MARKTKPLTLGDLDAVKCSKCYYKRAGDKSWEELVLCALHTPPPPPEPAKKLYRVCWMERYCEDVEAEDNSQAMEIRSGDNSFQECTEVYADPVCMKCQGTGKAARGASCGVCKDGVIPEEA